MGYILELRELIGKRPLFSPDATVVAFDDQNRVLHFGTISAWMALPQLQLEPLRSVTPSGSRRC